jgi:peroxiredoxin
MANNMRQPIFILALICLTASPGYAAADAGAAGWVEEAPAAAAEIGSVRPLMIGQRAPDAQVLGVNGSRISLKRVLDGKQTVLVFYRGGWCPYCNRQLAQLRHIEATLRQIGYQVVALSGDAPEKLRAGVLDKPPPYTLLSDVRLDAARRFGLAYRVTAKDFLTSDFFDDWVKTRSSKFPGVEPALPVPAVYLVGPDGIVLYQYVNIDHRVRLSAEVLLTAAKVYGGR